MKKAILINFNDILTPLYSTFEVSDLSDITDPKKKPDCLITWTDFTPDHKMMALAAMQQGIPAFMVQHGRRAMRDYWTNIGQPSCLAAFVWGTQDYEDALKGGWAKEQVFRVGAPWFAFRPKRQEEKGLVIYDVPHWSLDTPEAIATWNALKTIPGIRPIAKLISPSEQKQENYLGEQCLTFRSEPGHLEATYDLISRASAVVCMMESSLELLAHSLGVPVVHVRGFKHKELAGTWQGVEDTLPGKGSLACDLKDLAASLKLVMDNPALKRDEAQERLHEDAGFPDTDTPTQSITTIVTELTNTYQKEGHQPTNIFNALSDAT